MIFQREKLAKTQNIDAMVLKHFFKQSQMTITGLVLNRLKLAQLPSNISRIQKNLFNETLWVPGEPSNINSARRQCVDQGVQAQQYKYNDWDCKEKLGFICEGK